jgi:transcription elongation factor Elf1
MKPQDSDVIYSASDSQRLELSCPDCGERTVTTVESMEADNQLVCAHCMSIREVDVPDILKRRQMILNAVSNFKNS